MWTVLTRCAFCAHSNPSGARFCNECGSPLHLAPCDACGTVNDLITPTCCHCGAPLGVEHEAPAPALTGAQAASPGRAEPTVAVAYGDPHRVPKGALQEWLASLEPADEPPPVAVATRDRWRARADVQRASLSTVATVAPAGEFADDPADRFIATPRHASVRPRYAAMGFGVVIAASLVALGGYLFLTRELVTAPPEPAAVSAPTIPIEPAGAPDAAATAPAEAPRGDAVPQPTAPAGANSDRDRASNASSDDAPRTSVPKTERRPTAASRNSTDAIATERIIARELGGFAPRPTR